MRSAVALDGLFLFFLTLIRIMCIRSIYKIPGFVRHGYAPFLLSVSGGNGRFSSLWPVSGL